MPADGQTVKKSTMYLAMGATLIIGFLSGVVYTVYNSPEAPATSPAASQQSELAAAITSLELETQTNPDNTQAWVQLGHAYFDSDQFAKAIDAYGKSLELAPGDVNVMTDLGVMYRRNGEPRKAIATFEDVLKIDPEHEQARFNLGVVLLNDIKDTQAALDQWRKLVELHPDAKTPSGTPVGELIKQFAESAK